MNSRIIRVHPRFDEWAEEWNRTNGKKSRVYMTDKLCDIKPLVNKLLNDRKFKTHVEKLYRKFDET